MCVCTYVLLEINIHTSVECPIKVDGNEPFLC
jgi:hypothetical protein